MLQKEGCFDNKEMFIKIYPHKLVMKRIHSEYNFATGIDRDEVYRYITPSEKYGAFHSHEVMSNLNDLFTSCYYVDNSDSCGIYYKTQISSLKLI